MRIHHQLVDGVQDGVVVIPNAVSLEIWNGNTIAALLVRSLTRHPSSKDLHSSRLHVGKELLLLAGREGVRIVVYFDSIERLCFHFLECRKLTARAGPTVRCLDRLSEIRQSGGREPKAELHCDRCLIR